MSGESIHCFTLPHKKVIRYDKVRFKILVSSIQYKMSESGNNTIQAYFVKAISYTYKMLMKSTTDCLSLSLPCLFSSLIFIPIQHLPIALRTLLGSRPIPHYL